jgi:hypothetical protein
LISFLIRLSLCFASLCCGATWASAQSIEAEINVTSLSPPRVRVEGRRDVASAGWTFLDSYAGVNGLGGRVENFNLKDERGGEVSVKRVAAGRYEATRPATHFSYELRLDPPPALQAAAHVSWLTGEQGVLLPGDLLPLASERVSLRLTLPDGWTVSTIERKGAGGRFEVDDPSRSVFICGRGLRERRGRAGGVAYLLTLSGSWAFGDGDANESVVEILKLHAATAGTQPRGEALIALLPPPGPAGATQWAAETRGQTVTLVSGQPSSKLVALAQLDGALSHELFHLWAPNSLRLTGDYAWFYEGFTNYQALLVGMRRGQLSFRDYLNALGRAYDSYGAARGTSEVPLVASGETRWTGNAALVYHKGLLVAFLSDLTLGLRSGGRQSLTDVYRDLFRRHTGVAAPTEGNDAVIAALRRMAGGGTFVERYILSPGQLVLQDELAAFGLRVETGGVRTHLAVADTLTREQRDLLKKFGYNERVEARPRQPGQRPRGR